MRVKGPIPDYKLQEFIEWMRLHDHEDLSDGAWFAVLEEAAQQFMAMHKLKGCNNRAALQYLMKGGHKWEP